MRRFCSPMFLTALLFAVSCGDDPAADSINVETMLSEAATYLGTSMPDFGNTVGAHSRNEHGGSIEFITPTNWASSNGSDQINPPGGQVNDPTDEPQYGGANLPTSVNYRDFMKMALDENYRRKSGDGRLFRPTVFGRFDSVVTILTHMRSAGVTIDASGLPAVGDYNISYTLEDRMTLRIIAHITATTDTTYYDRRVDLTGFIDANANATYDIGEQIVMNNLMWLRANTTALNIMMLEQSDRSRNRQRATVNAGSISILKWARDTGVMQFEYASTIDDAIANGNLEIFRAFVNGTNGKTYLYGFQGKANATSGTPDFLQYALYAPTGETTEGTVSLRQLRTNGDIWQGNVCATFTTGVGAAGDTTGEGEPASGGTCAGQAADAINTKAGIMGFANNLRADTTWSEAFDDKGFPATAKPDWEVAADRAAWLVAGEAISVSFSDRTGFIAAWDGTP